MGYKDLSFMYPFLWALAVGAGGYLVYIIWKYAKDLRHSPRELWLVSISQVIEYVAYSIMISTFTLWLTSDIKMSDMASGNYVATWSLGITVTIFVIGALVDAVGVKKILLIGTVLAIASRLFLATNTNIYVLTFLGFIPQAISAALLSPVISVAIKRFTKNDTSAMGFGLFYTLMNIGFALGGILFDFIRNHFGEYGIVSVPILGDISTYRFILLSSFLISLPTYLFMILMREGVDLNDDGNIVFDPKKEKMTGNFFQALGKTIAVSIKDAFAIFKNVMRQRAFWKFMLLLGLLLGVNYVFYHFSYTFPKYGIRVLGEGAKVGSIYGVINPVIIIFFVPFISWATRKMSSYMMILVGTILSSGSVFLVTLPPSFFRPISDSVFGRLIWQEWLGVSPNTSSETIGIYMALCFFVVIFTFGEAIWSPRLMEYTARIAPKGQEGSYLSLALLPKFIAQPLVGIMSGSLLSTYVPAKEVAGKQVVGDISNHYMVWFWIGVVAITSPIGMIVFRKFVSNKEESQNS